MARARNIKPGFYKNEELAECSVWARLIFPGLWMLADRDGRLEDRPKRIKGELIPFDAQDVEPLLKELAAKKFILRYEIDGSRFIQICAFKRHQSPHYSEKKSVIKPPEFREIHQVIDRHDSKKRDGINGSDSEKDTGIKRGPQPPDSLNPDLLNPSSLNPERTAPSGEPPNGSGQRSRALIKTSVKPLPQDDGDPKKIERNRRAAQHLASGGDAEGAKRIMEGKV